jgi:hypothetical protein
VSDEGLFLTDGIPEAHRVEEEIRLPWAFSLEH